MHSDLDASHFRTLALPHSRTLALSHSRTLALPHSRTATKKPADRSRARTGSSVQEGDREARPSAGIGYPHLDVVGVPVHHQLAVVHSRGHHPAVQVPAVPPRLLSSRLRVGEVVHRHVGAARMAHGLGY